MLPQVQPTSHTPEGNIRTTLSGYSGCVPGPCWQVVQGHEHPLPIRVPFLAQGGWGAGPHQLHTITSCLNGARGSAPSHQLSHLGLCAPSQRREKVPTMHPHSVLPCFCPAFPKHFCSAPAPSPFPRLISLDLGMWRGRKGLPGQRKDRVTSRLPMRTEPHGRRRHSPRRADERAVGTPARRAEMSG